MEQRGKCPSRTGRQGHPRLSSPDEVKIGAVSVPRWFRHRIFVQRRTSAAHKGEKRPATHSAAPTTGSKRLPRQVDGAFRASGQQRPRSQSPERQRTRLNSSPTISSRERRRGSEQDTDGSKHTSPVTKARKSCIGR